MFLVTVIMRCIIIWDDNVIIWDDNVIIWDDNVIIWNDNIPPFNIFLKTSRNPYKHYVYGQQTNKKHTQIVILYNTFVITL